jgi:hypothetical protein
MRDCQRTVSGLACRQSWLQPRGKGNPEVLSEFPVSFSPVPLAGERNPAIFDLVRGKDTKPFLSGQLHMLRLASAELFVLLRVAFFPFPSQPPVANLGWHGTGREYASRHGPALPDRWQKNSDFFSHTSQVLFQVPGPPS